MDNKIKTDWCSLPLDVREAIVGVRANLTLAAAGFADENLFESKRTAMAKLLEAISLTDGLMTCVAKEWGDRITFGPGAKGEVILRVPQLDEHGNPRAVNHPMRLQEALLLLRELADALLEHENEA